MEKRKLKREDFKQVRSEDPGIWECSVFEVCKYDGEGYTVRKQPYPGCNYDDWVCEGQTWEDILPQIQDVFEEYLDWVLYNIQ